ncbi:MAG: hypothetical protein V4805_19525 [Pseudomonadota bacterium]
MWIFAGWSVAAEPNTGSALQLRAKYAELADRLKDTQFKRPLQLDSVELPNQLKGDVYAVLNYPIASVNTALTDPTHWCDLLILHINTKYCHASIETSTENLSAMLAVSIGKKFDQPIKEAYRVNFLFGVASNTPDYFDVRLKADSGPVGTTDYRIGLEAVALPGNKTFVHFTYSYSYGIAARIGMKAYLSTIGRNKIGFTNLAKAPSARPDYVGGVRGVVERNTMRYFLAIDAYLSALTLPPQEQMEQRLQNWFAATEQYPRQLHEMDRDDYLEMKRSEIERQQTAQ